MNSSNPTDKFNYHRLFIGSLILIVLSLIVISCHWLKIYEGQVKSVTLKNLGLPLFLLILSPLMVISIREIMALIGGQDRVKAIIAVYLTVIFPILSLTIINWISSSGLNRTYLGYYLTILIAMVFFMSLMSSKIFGHIFNFEAWKWERKLSFRRLMIALYLFWNCLFWSLFCLPTLILTLIFSVVILSDVFGYLLGKRFGKRRIFRSSPNKTLEGLVGSVILVYAVFLIISFSIGYGYVSGQMDSNGFLGKIFLFPLFFSIISPLGDFFFSKQKRIFDVKDYGTIFRSHGGFWDRFDSHTFSLVFALICVSLNSLFNSTTNS